MSRPTSEEIAAELCLLVFWSRGFNRILSLKVLVWREAVIHDLERFCDRRFAVARRATHLQHDELKLLTLLS
jgi:hypothetical protein